MWWMLGLPLCCCIPRITPSYEDNNAEKVGTSEGYNIASDTLTKNINFSVDPCENFFEFTCGKWIANHPLADHNVYKDQTSVLYDKVKEQMRDIFERKELFGTKSENTLRLIYKKCMDKGKLNGIGAIRLIKNIKSFGVWPILEGDKKWKEENYNLTSLLIYASQNRGVSAFISYAVYPDYRNVSRRLIKFKHQELSLGSPIYYLEKIQYAKEIEKLKKYLISKVELLQEDAGLPTKRAKIEKDVDEIIDLETKMAEILANQNMSLDFRHLSDMQRLMPLVDWLYFFHAIAPLVSHQYLDSNPEIVIICTDYVKRINHLLQSTDPRIITNYFFIRIIIRWRGIELGDKYEELALESGRMMWGIQQKTPRWMACTESAMNSMKHAANAILVKKAFDQVLKNVTLDMIDDLQEAFSGILNTSDWINDRTKTSALKKLKQMRRVVAFPDFILDDKKLDEYYDGLHIRATDSYIEMLDKVAKWKIEQSFKRLLRAADPYEYNCDMTASAYYIKTQNTMVIPAASLRAPYLHPTFPRALNYGGIGAIIGHEITHGFDNIGHYYDAVGNLRPWWNANMEKKFMERAQCIIDQYGKIEVPETGLKIDGELTQAENIADNAGVKQAYRAYKAYLQKHGGEEDRIKGLEQYNNEQMFFLGYATIWCGHSTQEASVHDSLTDGHAPHRYRVNQVLANQPEFAAAFRCKVGTAMNPTERCAVW